VANISLGNQKVLSMGNLDSKRDWGHAKDYVEAMYLILQQDKPEDYVIASGMTTTVRDFILMAFQEVGIKLRFEGEGVDEVGIIDSVEEERFTEATGKKPNHLKLNTEIIKVDPYYFRPTEVDLLHGDPTKAMKKLNWKPKYNLQMLVKEMVQSDVLGAKKSTVLKDVGFDVINRMEDIL
jgi:GDPmannose 4,6-dehydratase